MDLPETQPTAPPPSNAFRRALAASVRWLHIYLSMFGLVALLFFAVTGITLNHPDWAFANHEREREVTGQLPMEWLVNKSAADPLLAVDRLSIVEHLRSEHQIRGALRDFSGDEYQLIVGFAGPGYTADAYIEREDGTYSLNERSQGLVATLNDLHKGRDTGPVWAWVIDVIAVMMLLASLSGMYLLLGLKRRRRAGLFNLVIGAVVVVVIYMVWVP